MDNFKPLNDIHGHYVGDLLLTEVAHRISSCVREVDMVARFGGDEFVVVLSDLNADKAESAKQARIVAEKICLILGKPYVLKFEQEGQTETTVEHLCTTSIGVIVFNDLDGNQDDILRWADAAMYQSKDAGGNSIQFHGSSAD